MPPTRKHDNNPINTSREIKNPVLCVEEQGVLQHIVQTLQTLDLSITESVGTHEETDDTEAQTESAQVAAVRSEMIELHTGYF